MCGRFSFVIDKGKVKSQMPKLRIEGDLQKNANIAPTQKAYIITHEAPDRLEWAQWGLVPHWAKEAKQGGKLINARMESLLEKPSFRESFQSKRCLVLADSFYEWKNKTPYRIYRNDGALLIFGGLYDLWQNNLKTFSIITTTPNAEMAQVHTRMPVILNEAADVATWLSANSPVDRLMKICRTPPDGLLGMYRVSEKINSAKFRTTETLKPAPEDLTLF